MDKDKLNKAAIQNKHKQYWTKHSHRISFVNGVYWLMRQPLSERLTDEEKEKILEIHTTNAYLITESEDRVLNAYSIGVMAAIERIFKDLFKEK